MIATVEKDGALYQDHAVSSIILNFGEEFSYLNDNGNQAIHRDILKIFRKISDNIVIWDRGERMWRLRDKFDAPGRMQE